MTTLAPFIVIVMLIALIVWGAMYVAFLDGRRRGRNEACQVDFMRSSVERSVIYRDGYAAGVESLRPML